jgi:hypothetical protein
MDPQGHPPVVIFYTDNGLGLGHLTRQAAVASRAEGAFQPLFLTMSAGFTLLRPLGIPGEYFPSYGRLGMERPQWEPLMAERLLEAIDLTGASVVVVDHVSPPRILGSLRAQIPHVKLVWSRRGLWQPGKNRGVERLGENFDVVLEPGDLASPIDQGATVAVRHETIPISPVIITDPREMTSRGEARERLGIPSVGRAILVSLGDADPSEIGNLISHTRLVVDRVSPDQIHLFAPLHPLHGDRIPEAKGVVMRPVYPISRYLNAFDGAISTAGYNSFHEVVASGLPAVFVPHRGAAIDDQARRAEFAALCGRAHWAPDVYSDDFNTAVARMLRAGEIDVARKTTTILGEMRGAHEFAAFLADLARVSTPAADQMATAPPAMTRSIVESRETLVNVLDHDDDQLRDLALSMRPAGVDQSVFVVRDGNPKPLFEMGAVFESVFTEREWASVGRHDYGGYLESRLAGITRRYGTSRIIAPQPETTHRTRSDA